MSSRSLTRLTNIVWGTTLYNGRREKWAADSVCGRWRFERQDVVGTPWLVEFVPTGQQVWGYRSLDKARQWTASGQAIPFLRGQAQDVIVAGGRCGEVRHPLDDAGRPYRYEVPEDPEEVATRLAEARRQVAILDVLACDTPAMAHAVALIWQPTAAAALVYAGRLDPPTLAAVAALFDMPDPDQAEPALVATCAIAAVLRLAPWLWGDGSRARQFILDHRRSRTAALAVKLPHPPRADT